MGTAPDCAGPGLADRTQVWLRVTWNSKWCCVQHRRICSFLSKTAGRWSGAAIGDVVYPLSVLPSPACCSSPGQLQAAGVQGRRVGQRDTFVLSQPSVISGAHTKGQDLVVWPCLAAGQAGTCVDALLPKQSGCVAQKEESGYRYLAMVGAAVLLRLAPSPGHLVSDQRWRDTSTSSVPGPCVCRDRWSHPGSCAFVEAGHTDAPVSHSGGHHSACEDSFLALPQFLCLIISKI